VRELGWSALESDKRKREKNVEGPHKQEKDSANAKRDSTFYKEKEKTVSGGGCANTAIKFRETFTEGKWSYTKHLSGLNDFVECSNPLYDAKSKSEQT